MRIVLSFFMQLFSLLLIYLAFLAIQHGVNPPRPAVNLFDETRASNLPECDTGEVVVSFPASGDRFVVPLQDGFSVHALDAESPGDQGRSRSLHFSIDLDKRIACALSRKFGEMQVSEMALMRYLERRACQIQGAQRNERVAAFHWSYCEKLQARPWNAVAQRIFLSTRRSSEPEATYKSGMEQWKLQTRQLAPGEQAFPTHTNPAVTRRAGFNSYNDRLFVLVDPHNEKQEIRTMAFLCDTYLAVNGQSNCQAQRVFSKGLTLDYDFLTPGVPLEKFLETEAELRATLEMLRVRSSE